MEQRKDDDLRLNLPGVGAPSRKPGTAGLSLAQAKANNAPNIIPSLNVLNQGNPQPAKPSAPAAPAATPAAPAFGFAGGAPASAVPNYRTPQGAGESPLQRLKKVGAGSSNTNLLTGGAPVAPNAQLSLPAQQTAAPALPAQAPTELTPVAGLDELSALSQGLGPQPQHLFQPVDQQQPASIVDQAAAVKTPTGQAAAPTIATTAQAATQAIAQPPAIQPQPQQPPGSIIPEGSIEIIRGRPNGDGNTGAGGGFERSFAVPDGRGGFSEVGPPPSPLVQQQVGNVLNKPGSVESAQAQTNLQGLQPGLVQPVAEQAAIAQTINAQQKLQRENNTARAKAEQAKAVAPQLEKVGDGFGGEKLVIFDPQTGKQRSVENSSGDPATNRVAAERELRREVPDASDEEINAFLDKKFSNR